ncbi:unnamed protein product [Rotaria socialis]|nr:unnamed protein product [Rotaria socialis]CAF4284867.1 unnamed protein product [Rotaria socialis]CAF4511003.1 unnamed protein product [Rotaria socialis]CAF4606977.1 unnamed protein product [Rotaria socialis]CAF4640674.1 unnamed protein product [Rotaria socialis]
MHRKNLSEYDADELIVDFLVKQIRQQLESIINPNEHHDLFEWAKILVTELLSKEPSLCAEEIINRVITIMNTPICLVDNGSNIINTNRLPSGIENSPTIHPRSQF